MTKKKNLTAFMIAIMVMLFSLPANAQGTVGYVVWDGAKTLTFKGGASVPTTGAYKLYELNTGSNRPAWISDVASSCTNVVFDESFNDVRPTSCFQWFQGFFNLSTISYIRYLNTDSVKTMQAMFDGCSKLTSLNLSNFNTANVEYMDNMFNGCSKLTSLDLSSFNTDKVGSMCYMFNGCSDLTSLDLSSFNTDKVGLMYNMFYDCSGLTSLDLSSFNTANVTDMDNMFYGCSGLTTIYVSDDFTTNEVSSSTGMFGGCTSLNGKVPYNSDEIDKKMANYTGYFTKSNLTPYVKWNGYTKVLTFKVANYTEGTQVEWKLNEGDTSPGWVWNVNSVCEKVVFTPSFKQAKPTSCYHWFYGFSNLSTIEGIGYLNTDSVTNMHAMFYNCSELTSLDVSKFNTANVTTMRAMFDKCSKLTSLGVSNFNTTKVKNMGFMFNGCSGLTSLDLSSFNTDSVTYMECMFYGCSGLTSLDVSNFNTANVTWMYYMFGDCKDLTSLDLSSFNTANVTWMYDMFNGCKSLTSLDLSSFNTAKVTDMRSMFKDCSKLTTIYVSDGFTTGIGTNGNGMFGGCSKLVGATSYSNSGKTGKDMANYETGYFKTYFTLGKNKVELCGNPLTTKSLDLTGDYDFTPKYEFKANTATYSRDLSTSGSTWFSLCLPFAYTPDNFTAYKLMSATDDAVEIEEMTGKIVAGTPVLFKFKDGAVKEINLSATGANIVKAPVGGATVTGPDGSSLQLCGTYQTKTFSSEDRNAFILLNNKLMNPAKMLATTGVTSVGVKPFRVYMTLTASTESSAQPASARAFSIGRGDEEGTTAIDLLNSVATGDAEYYDINGRRIDAPAKGVNIVRRGNKTMKLIIK